jgi:hypothetical protein
MPIKIVKKVSVKAPEKTYSKLSRRSLNEEMRLNVTVGSPNFANAGNAKKVNHIQYNRRRIAKVRARIILFFVKLAAVKTIRPRFARAVLNTYCTSYLTV